MSLRDFKLLELTNTVWAFATVGHKQEQLFIALAAAGRHMSLRDSKSQELTNTAWAFATVGQREARLFTALAAAAEPGIWDFES